MFTGIVQAMGTLADVERHAGGLRLLVKSAPACIDAHIGDSICVSGVCLTVAGIDADVLVFDVVQETLARTNLGRLGPQDRVNLERSLRVGDGLDGHMVQGHVDGTAKVDRVSTSNEQHVVWLHPQPHLQPYVIPKGSIALDGVSLTIAEIAGDTFSVALIPTTLEKTTLAGWRTGDVVNVESDMMVRTIVACLERLRAGGGPIFPALGVDTLRVGVQKTSHPIPQGQVVS